MSYLRHLRRAPASCIILNTLHTFQILKKQCYFLRTLREPVPLPLDEFSSYEYLGINADTKILS